MLDHTPIDIDKLYYSIGIDVQYYNMLPFGSLSTIHWAHLDLVVFKTLRHVYESALYCTKWATAENKCRFKASCSCFLLNYPVKIRDYWHTSLLNAPIIMMKLHWWQWSNLKKDIFPQEKFLIQKRTIMKTLWRWRKDILVLSGDSFTDIHTLLQCCCLIGEVFKTKCR